MTKNKTFLTSEKLKSQLKKTDENSDENNRIRLHRAISWLKCSEEQSGNPDLKFISLWIAFNACYADNEIFDASLTEKKRFKEFINKLVRLDQDGIIFDILWHKFSGSIRILIDNKYAFKQFWDAQKNKYTDWETLFERSRKDSRKYLVNQQVAELFGVVLDRLYTVRNQVLHGGATYMSKVNRSQVKDAGRILEFVIPVIIDIMITNIHDDWGKINYPVIKND